MPASTTPSPSRSPIRWAGSKKKSLPLLRTYWSSSYRRYVEPFAGSASLFFDINPKRAILGDINTELTTTLSAIRDNPTAVFSSLRPRPVTKKYYNKLRAVDAIKLSASARAARFLFLNRYCFNGIYRTNLSGKFNVPFAPHKTGARPSLKQLKTCSEKLKNTIICNEDFEDLILKHVRRGDFVYLDPPYMLSKRRMFREYDSAGFNIGDLNRLSLVLDEIDRRGAKFIMSYAYCTESINLFSKWKAKKHYVQRNVSGFVEQRRMAAEVIVTNID